jgi:membrane-bound lytic murein transglycosylase B
VHNRAMRVVPVVMLALAGALAPLGAGAHDPGPEVSSAPRSPHTATEVVSGFAQWLEGVLAEARGRGFGDELLRSTLAGLQPLAEVLERDRRQPELTISFAEYLARRVTPEMVRRGRELVQEHAALLARVHESYDVEPAFVVAIWGIETRYGQHAGTMPVFQALATLAWDARRSAFFRGQLFDALTMVQRGHIEPSRMLGSWAGAMGQPQFMPSSYLAYAVDFDGDGRRDIWTSHADTFASIANYLKQHGWRGREPWGREVRVSPSAADRIARTLEPRPSGCRAMRSMIGPAPLADWQRLGIRQPDGSALPATAGTAALVRVDARQFLTHANYDALLRYNCAHHYALTVAILADRIRDGHGATVPPPAPPAPSAPAEPSSTRD